MSPALQVKKPHGSRALGLLNAWTSANGGT